MEGTGMTPADIMALTNGNDNGMAAILQNPFVYLIWIWAFRMFNNDNRDSAAVQGALTRADLFEGFNNQGVNDKLNDITTGLCNSFATVNSNINQGNNSIIAALAENRFTQQQCCCENRQAIAALSAENYRNTCEITTAIHAEGEATRALINENTIQALRDKLADKDRDILYANLQISQKEQNETLVDTLRPTPRPAYITCSPYTSSGSYCAGSYGSCGA